MSVSVFRMSRPTSYVPRSSGQSQGHRSKKVVGRHNDITRCHISTNVSAVSAYGPLWSESKKRINKFTHSRVVRVRSKGDLVYRFRLIGRCQKPERILLTSEFFSESQLTVSLQRRRRHLTFKVRHLRWNNRALAWVRSTYTTSIFVACTVRRSQADSHDRAHLLGSVTRVTVLGYQRALFAIILANDPDPWRRNTLNIHGSLKRFLVSCYLRRRDTLGLGLVRGLCRNGITVQDSQVG